MTHPVPGPIAAAFAQGTLLPEIGAPCGPAAAFAAFAAAPLPPFVSCLPHAPSNSEAPSSRAGIAPRIEAAEPAAPEGNERDGLAEFIGGTGR
ncbi:hypothetical protein [Burkholderia sp. Ac-20379]|uniref:hypothetical protein n=1 Tax=Burkholderia sp. Ac-20379 TaxID=2703900 RepID=UPI00197E656A|nr:hypothetical protein [Burkholderia sp. Ac-20379]MBN3728485.1 hypothetical protein [Burkholderia sp. Ac-20379]